MKFENLVGSRFAFEYANETYEIHLLNQNQLRWVRTAGENTGQEDQEDYVCSQLNEHTVLITWVEADGLGLSNVLNFLDMTLITHANMGREVFENPGKFKSLK